MRCCLVERMLAVDYSTDWCSGVLEALARRTGNKQDDDVVFSKLFKNVLEAQSYHCYELSSRWKMWVEFYGRKTT